MAPSIVSVWEWDPLAFRMLDPEIPRTCRAAVRLADQGHGSTEVLGRRSRVIGAPVINDEYLLRTNRLTRTALDSTSDGLTRSIVGNYDADHLLGHVTFDYRVLRVGNVVGNSQKSLLIRGCHLQLEVTRFVDSSPETYALARTYYCTIPIFWNPVAQ